MALLFVRTAHDEEASDVRTEVDAEVLFACILEIFGGARKDVAGAKSPSHAFSGAQRGGETWGAQIVEVALGEAVFHVVYYRDGKRAFYKFLRPTNMSVAMKYVNRELLAIFVVTLTMLLLVALGGRFIGYLQEAAVGKFTGSTVLMIMALRLPEFIQIVAPFSIYIAVVLTLGRLFAEQEMVVFQGAGVDTLEIVKWVSLTLSFVVVGVTCLAWYVTPSAERALTEFLAIERAQSEFEALNPNRFHVYDRGKRVTYSQGMSDDRRELQGVFMSQTLDDGRRVTIWAKTGRQRVDPQTGSQYLVLREGRRYEGEPGQADYRITEFDQLSQRLTVDERRRDKVDVEALPTLELPSDAPGSAEWHWRLALPLFCAIGGLLGVGISKVKPREGRFTKVVPGMLLMLFYYLGLLVNKNAIAEEQLPAVLGLWIVHAAFLGLAVYLLRNFGKPSAS